MNSDDFEKRLQRQTVRPIPSEWRHDILQATNAASNPDVAPKSATFRSMLVEMFWPCPQAWVGLAAIWIVILASSITTREPKVIMVKAPPPSREFKMAMKEQRRLYLELMGLPSRRDEEHEQIQSGPRSNCDENVRIV